VLISRWRNWKGCAMCVCVVNYVVPKFAHTRAAISFANGSVDQYVVMLAQSFVD
jgi:hypothetical protein